MDSEKLTQGVMKRLEEEGVIDGEDEQYKIIREDISNLWHDIDDVKRAIDLLSKDTKSSTEFIRNDLKALDNRVREVKAITWWIVFILSFLLFDLLSRFF